MNAILLAIPPGTPWGEVFDVAVKSAFSIFVFVVSFGLGIFVVVLLLMALFVIVEEYL